MGRVTDHTRKESPSHTKSKGTRQAQRVEKLEAFGIDGEVFIVDGW